MQKNTFRTHVFFNLAAMAMLHSHRLSTSSHASIVAKQIQLTTRGLHRQKAPSS